MDLKNVKEIIEACNGKAKIIEIEKDKIKIVFGGGLHAYNKPAQKVLPEKNHKKEAQKNQKIQEILTKDEEEELMISNPLAYENYLYSNVKPRNEIERQRLSEQVFEGEVYL